jgi:predicted Ser/Thr protein kinase
MPDPSLQFFDEVREKTRNDFQNLLWEGSFADYLKLAHAQPQIIRSAYQRLYDMIRSYGREEVSDGRATTYRYTFFSDPDGGGEDAVYGLDHSLQKLVNIFKSGAYGYGPERRLLLLHGPVGSAKSTIVRLLKRGIETYSRKPEGALYSFRWIVEAGDSGRKVRESDQFPCPMHEEPLKLIPADYRDRVVREIQAKSDLPYRLRIDDALLTAFVTNNVFIVLPMLAEHCERLAVRHGFDHAVDQHEVGRHAFADQLQVGLLVGSPGNLFQQRCRCCYRHAFGSSAGSRQGDKKKKK